MEAQQPNKLFLDKEELERENVTGAKLQPRGSRVLLRAGSSHCEERSGPEDPVVPCEAVSGDLHISTLQKAPRRQFKRNTRYFKGIVGHEGGPGEQAGLSRHNKGNKQMITVSDIFNKLPWAISGRIIVEGDDPLLATDL